MVWQINICHPICHPICNTLNSLICKSLQSLGGSVADKSQKTNFMEVSKESELCCWRSELECGVS